MNKLVVIRPGKPAVEEIPYEAGKFSLDLVREHLGGWATPVLVRYQGNIHAGYLDEDGYPRRLEANPLADTLIARDQMRSSVGPVVGPLVIDLGTVMRAPR